MSRCLRSLWTAVFLLAGFETLLADEWHHPLFLDGDGYWKQRIRVVVHNERDNALEGQSVALVVGTGEGQADLAGQPAEAVRVVDRHGAELCFAVRSADGQPIPRGAIPAGAAILLPVDCPPHMSAAHYVYSDNPCAGEVPDFLPEQPDSNQNDANKGLVSIRAEKPEKRVLQEGSVSAGWLQGLPAGAAAADRRLAVRVFNFSDEPVAQRLASLDAAALAVRTGGRIASCILLANEQGQPVPYETVGETILFAASAPAKSAATWQLYMWDRPPGGLPLPAESDGSLWRRFNRIKNAGFEEGQSIPDAWIRGIDPQHPGITAGLDDPGRADLGRRCVRLHVPKDAPGQWRGWRQSVPVEPGKTYLLRAWVKSKDLEEPGHVHVHLRTADGGLCKEDAMTRIGPPVSGTTDWTLMSGILTTPSDAAALELHLTMAQSGTLWHDELALVEVVPASAGMWEGRPLTGSEELRMWPVPAVVKVLPDDPAPAQPAEAWIGVARNEKEPLQLAVRSGRVLKGVQIQLDPPLGPNGAKLDTFSVNVVGLVPIDHPTSYYHSRTPAWHRKYPTGQGGSDGWRGCWPDPLLPRAVFGLQANATQALWITFAVGKEQPAGSYAGRVRLVEQGQVLAEIPITVRVWDFTLPEKSHVAAIYDVRFGPGGQHWGESFPTAYDQITPYLSENRICADCVRPEPTIRYDSGQVVADFADFDRAAENYFDRLGLPFSYTPWFFYLFGWGHPPKQIFGEHPYPGEPPYKDADRSQLRPEYKRLYQACLKTFWDHLKTKGWENKFVLYISDEPFDSQPPIRAQMKALCDMIHEVDPKIPIYSSTWHHVPEWDGYLDVWGIGHYGVVSPEKMAQLRAAGKRIWFTTDGQMCTDTPYCAVERLLPHYCFHYGAEAYEFWGVSWYTYDPFRFGWHAYIRQSEQPGHSYWIRYPNGDGYLLYPGKPIGHTGPISSVRFEQAREGVEDYQYLHLLRQLMDRQAGGDTTKAAAALQRARQLVAIPNAGGRYSSRILPEPQSLYDTRRAVAESIEALAP